MTLITLLTLIIIILLSALIYLSINNKTKNKDTDILNLLINSFKSDKEDLTSRLDKIDQKLFETINASGRTMQNQFHQHKDLIKEISTELTQLKETNQQVLGFTEKLQNLENILSNPKKRGIMGEFFLETILMNVLPPELYKIQYRFSNMETVDAVIYYQDKIIPVDSKFSLEKYTLIESENNQEIRQKLIKEFNIDIKNRIEETAKYIKEEEGTTDFAFMFIPAEGIYLNLLNFNREKDSITNKDIFELAFRKKVIIVSPISFYAYLQTVLQGLKSIKVEKSIKEIMKKIVVLGKDIEKYEIEFSKLGRQLETSVKTYNTASSRLKKIDKDIYSLSESKEDKKDFLPYEINQ